MSWLKRIKHICDECSHEALEHTLEYNTSTKENTNHWFCDKHRPEWDVKYLPMNAFKKIFHEGAINYVRNCNEKGELNNESNKKYDAWSDY